jgi:hypothetical protein
VKPNHFDVDELARKLSRRKGRSAANRPISTGIYALFANKRNILRAIHLGRTGLLYIGMTADPAGERNHFAHAHSGFSSPRRTLGALLKDVLNLRAIPRSRGPSRTNWSNYRFSDAGEAALTRWMRQNLSMSHVRMAASKAAIKTVEKRLIARLKPPLNLKGMTGSETHRVLSELRRLCRD